MTDFTQGGILGFISGCLFAGVVFTYVLSKLD